MPGSARALHKGSEELTQGERAFYTRGAYRRQGEIILHEASSSYQMGELIIPDRGAHHKYSHATADEVCFLLQIHFYVGNLYFSLRMSAYRGELDTDLE